MNIGTLTIELAANVARIQKDMNEVKGVVDTTMKAVETSVNLAKQAFVAMTGVASVQAFRSLVDGVVSAKVELLHLSQQTGASVESLSAIGGVAKMTGANIGDVSSAINKLQKNLATSNEDSKGAAEALKALGINFDSFAKQSPDQQMLQVAKAMDNFQDGGGKSAAAMLLFGKSGAALLPMLDALAEKDNLVGKTTTESAREAVIYEQNIKALDAMSNTWKRTLVDELLPTLDKVTSAMVAGRKEAGAWASMKAGIQTFFTGDDQYKNDVALYEQTDRLLTLQQKLNAEMQGEKRAGYIKALQDSIKETKDELQVTQDYRKVLSDTADAEKAVKDAKEATREKNGQVKVKVPGTKAVDELPDAGLTMLNGLKNEYEQLTKSVDDYDKALRDIAAIKKQPSNDRKDEILGWAMLIQIEKEAAATKKQLIAYDVEQANKEFTQAQKQEDFVTAGNDARAAIIAQTNALGLNSEALARQNAMLQIDTLMKKAMVGATSETRQELEKLAVVMKGGMSDALDELKAKQEAMDGDWQVGAKNALEAYQKTVGNVAGFTQTAFTNAFKGMEDAMVNFVKTGKLDFNSLIDSMISDLIRYQVQQSIMKPLMKAMGPGGGMSDFFSSIFGGPRAAGGPVTGGTPYLVGEKGPELFIPGTSGGITPNHALGGSNVTVNVIEDSSKAGTQQQRQSSDGSNVIDVFVAQVKAAIAGDISRGAGAIPAALAQTYGVNRVAGSY